MKNHTLIKEIKVLKRQNKNDQALEYLNKLSQHAYPLMKRRNWRVGQLVGFISFKNRVLS